MGSADLRSEQFAQVVGGALGFAFGTEYTVEIVQITEEDGTPHVFGVRPTDVSRAETLGLGTREAPRRMHASGSSAWFRKRAAVRVPDRVAAWSARLGLHPSSVLIRQPKKRWSSADANDNVRFNGEIIQTPTRLIDYIVAHEPVHLAHPDTRDFWSAFG